MAGRLRSEQVAGFRRNDWPESLGIRKPDNKIKLGLQERLTAGLIGAIFYALAIEHVIRK